jgi:hypothetical protein
MAKHKMILSLFALLISAMPALAERVIRAEIQTLPPSQWTGEFGLIYSNTGLIPGRLQLFCKDFIDEDEWNGMLPGDERLCGELPLQIRLSSVGLSAFFMNYSQANPLTVALHVDPEVTSLRSILGIYRGAKAGAGIVAGVRGMILRNSVSGVWATTEQTLSPGASGSADKHSSLDLGFDISFPWLEVYALAASEMNRPIATLKKQLLSDAHAGEHDNTQAQ